MAASACVGNLQLIDEGNYRTGYPSFVPAYSDSTELGLRVLQVVNLFRRCSFNVLGSVQGSQVVQSVTLSVLLIAALQVRVPPE